MFFFFGSRLAGITQRCHGTHVATLFAHVNLLPLWPRRSFLILETQHAVDLGLDPTSVAAAYLRGWGIGAVLLATSLALLGFIPPVPALQVAAAGVACAGVGFLLGTLGPAERARRTLYRRHAGHAADPARLDPETRARLGERLRQDVTERATAWAGRTYRDGRDPAQAWAEIALDPAVQDAALVGAAMTLARLERPGADPAAQRRLDALHAALWERHRALARAR